MGACFKVIFEELLNEGVNRATPHVKRWWRDKAVPNLQKMENKLTGKVDDIEDTLGDGAFGTVFKCRSKKKNGFLMIGNKKKQKMYAVKKIKKSQASHTLPILVTHVTE